MHCSLTRAVAFHARHRYFRPEWSEEENRRRFGWTADAPGHGHLYRLEITVSGPLDPATSMIIDLVDLDALIADRLVAPLLGQLLNEAIPACREGTMLPSCEAVATWCWQQIAGALPPTVGLDRVRVAEDETLWAECSAPVPPVVRRAS